MAEACPRCGYPAVADDKCPQCHVVVSLYQASLEKLVPETGISFLDSHLPQVSSVAVAGGASSGGEAVTGSVIVDVFFITTKALIADGAQVNQHALAGWTRGRDRLRPRRR